MRHVTRAQANAIAELAHKKYGLWLRVDGPIADTGCVRVAWRESVAKYGEENAFARGVLYLNGKGQPVRWDSLRDRPLTTPSGKLRLVA